jgi:hypothetical protein
MAHGVELEVAEGDRLHLAVAGVVLDPVLVAPEAVAGVQDGAVGVGETRQLIEPTAGKDPKPLEMRLQVRAHAIWEVQRQQLLQPRVDGVEILPRAVRRDG